MIHCKLLFKLMALAIGIALLHGAVARADEITVAVAANVKYAFDDLAQEFKKETGIVAHGVFGASGQLTAQIENGAPFDVFLSADMEYPDALYRDKWAMGPPRTYASGALVLWTCGGLDLGRGIQALNDPAVRKIALANPRLAPYGRESIHALEHFGLRAALQSKLVYGESIGQVSQYVDARAVEIGFTAKSVVLAPEVKGKGAWIEVPRGSYQPIAQGLVILKHAAGANQDAVRRFADFLSGPAARSIFKQYGYILP